MSKHVLMVQSEQNTLDIIVTISEADNNKKLVSAKCSKRTCVTCDNFHEPQERCTLAGTRPPASVIAYGCEKWIDEVPF